MYVRSFAYSMAVGHHVRSAPASDSTTQSSTHSTYISYSLHRATINPQPSIPTHPTQPAALHRATSASLKGTDQRSVITAVTAIFSKGRPPARVGARVQEATPITAELQTPGRVGHRRNPAAHRARRLSAWDVAFLGFRVGWFWV